MHSIWTILTIDGRCPKDLDHHLFHLREVEWTWSIRPPPLPPPWGGVDMVHSTTTSSTSVRWSGHGPLPVFSLYLFMKSACDITLSLLFFSFFFRTYLMYIGWAVIYCWLINCWITCYVLFIMELPCYYILCYGNSLLCIVCIGHWFSE